ncbi:hypothetical protein AB0425_28915 [Actinosynnema sp. NPDC051121]
MVTNPSPTTLSTPPPGGGSGFTMDQSALDALRQQADDLRTGYQDVSSGLSGHTLAGNAFGTVGTFAVEAFNASHGKSVELTGKAASTLGLVGEGLKATAQTHLEADQANGEQFTSMESTALADKPVSAPTGGASASQGPPDSPGGSASAFQGPPDSSGGDASASQGPPDSSGGSASAFQGQTGSPGGGASAPQGPPDSPGGSATTQAPPPPIPEPSGAGAGAPTGQAGAAPTPPPPTAETTTAAARTPAAPAPTPTMPAFPEIPDPPPVPDGSAAGGGSNPADALKTTPSAGAAPPPMPPIPEAPKDLFKQPTIPDPTTGGSGGSGGSATTPSAGMTPPAAPPIPEVPKDLFKQHDPVGSSGTSGGSATTPSAGTTPPATPPIPEVPKDLFKSTMPDLDTDPRPGEQSPDDRTPSDKDKDTGKGTGEERPDRDTGDHRSDHEHHGEHRDHGDHGERGSRDEREQHGFPITSVDGKPCLDLRELPPEEGERWQDNIRDILATKGEGSFFWAGDTIDAQGQRHSLMDLAEFMTNLDADEPGSAPAPLSDDVTASPARSANGDVYVIVGPNHDEDDPVDLADFPTLQANPRIERVFAIDAVTGRETQIHPKVT